MSKQAYKRVRRALKMEVCRQPLDSFAWPGGYPLYYLCTDGGVLCPDCANREIALIDEAIKNPGCDKQWELIGVDINYEDTSLYCDHCSKQIESAYAGDATDDE